MAGRIHLHVDFITSGNSDHINSHKRSKFICSFVCLLALSADFAARLSMLRKRTDWQGAGPKTLARSPPNSPAQAMWRNLAPSPHVIKNILRGEIPRPTALYCELSDEIMLAGRSLCSNGLRLVIEKRRTRPRRTLLRLITQRRRCASS